MADATSAALFETAGAVLQPSLGACANDGPDSSKDIARVTVSVINRNFPERTSPRKMRLASPPTVAASAIAGRLASFDELRSMAN